jgi:choline-sulfatase
MSENISRREFVNISAMAAMAGTAIAAPLSSPAKDSNHNEHSNSAKKPNFVFFVPDSLRADSLACYGNPVVRTPNYDHVAADGVRFANCHIQFPVCGASRCSILTGWPASVRGHRSLYYFLRPDEPNLFRYLKQNGYDVYWFGKNDALATQTFSDSVTEWAYFGEEDVVLTTPLAKNPWPLGDFRYYSFLFGEGADRKQYPDYAHVQAGIRILEKQSDRPFCIFLALAAPHPPYTAPKGFHTEYSPSHLPPLKSEDTSRKPKFHSAVRKAYGLDRLDSSYFLKMRAVYLGMVSYTDWLLGELLEAMERTNRSQDTALFVFSDHGEFAGDYGLVEKWPSALEDSITRVPCLVRYPGIAKAHVSEEMIEMFDLMPTVLELAGIPAHHTHFARSLVPQLHGNPGDPQRAAFAEGGYNIYEPQCFEVPLPPQNLYFHKTQLQLDRPETVTRAAMVRTAKYKLIVRPAEEGEFYDYSQDPTESHNLYGDRSVSFAQVELEKRLLHWYVNTTGVAPMDKDPRELPPFYPTPQFVSPRSMDGGE